MARVLYRHRLFAALAVCLSGWALMPFVSFSREGFDWQLLSDGYKVFADGVESGDTSAWSGTVPPPPLRVPVPLPGEELVRHYVVDFGLLRQIRTESAFEILGGLSAEGQGVFALEARLASSSWELRARARRNDGSWEITHWRTMNPGTARLEVDWRRALELTRDGHLYVSLDQELVLWLVDLDNHHLRLAELSLARIQDRPLLELAAD